MDVQAILELVARRLPAAGVDVLLIGGYAVNHYGYTRNTLDIDFMIAADRVDAVKGVMVGAGFINVTVEENVVFFNHPDSPVRVDFLRVESPTLRNLLAHAIEAEIHGCRVKVPSLHDLLAMKIFAFSQNAARRMGKDLPDIAFLCVLHHLDLERDIRPVCERYGNARVFDLIKEQVEALQ